MRGRGITGKGKADTETTTAIVKQLCKRIPGWFFNPSLARLRCGRGRSLWVICYHHVSERSTGRGPTWPPRVGIRDLERHLEVFARHFRVSPLYEALCDLERNSLTRPTLCITFDDAPSSFATLAYPLLRKHNMPATVFVCGSASGEGEPLWNDALTMLWKAGQEEGICRLLDSSSADLASAGEAKSRAQDIYSDRLRRGILSLYAKHDPGTNADLYMDTACLRSLDARLVQFGSHTWSHAPLSALDGESLRREVARNEEYLARFPNRVPVLSVPYGGPSRFHPQQIRFLRQEMGLYVCSSYGGINFGPREADYLRIGGEVPGDQMAGHLILEVLRST